MRFDVEHPHGWSASAIIAVAVLVNEIQVITFSAADLPDEILRGALKEGLNLSPPTEIVIL